VLVQKSVTTITNLAGRLSAWMLVKRPAAWQEGARKKMALGLPATFVRFSTEQVRTACFGHRAQHDAGILARGLFSLREEAYAWRDLLFVIVIVCCIDFAVSRRTGVRQIFIGCWSNQQIRQRLRNPQCMTGAVQSGDPT
jgi:hypothetical protein